MDPLDRLYTYLVDVLRRAGVDGPTHECTIAEIYQKLVPYRGVRSELGFSELARYEHTLLRLLAGEGERVSVDLPQVQEEFRTELEASNPILGVYRDYAAVGVRIEMAAARPASDPERTSPPQPRVPDPPAPSKPRLVPSEPAPTVSARGEDCPHCGEKLPRGRDARFCPFCGAGIRAAPCSECGEEVEPGWRFCLGCGHPSSLPGRR